MEYFRIRQVVLIGFVAGALQSGCRPSGQLSGEFESKLQVGRKPIFGRTVKQSNDLGLTQKEIFETRIDPLSGKAGVILFDLSLMPNVEEGEIQTFSDAKVSELANILGVKLEELEISGLSGESFSPKVRVVNYTRIYDSIPVRDSYLQLYFIQTNEGSFRLREIVNRTYGEISHLQGQVPSLSLQDIANQTGLASLTVERESANIFVSVAEGKYVFSYAKTYKVKDAARDEDFALTFSQAGLMEAFSFTQSLSHKFSAEVPERTYIRNNLVSKALSYMSVEAVKGKALATDKDGIVELDALESGQKVQVGLASDGGPAIVVDRKVAVDKLATYEIATQDGGTLIKVPKEMLPAFMAFFSVQEVVAFTKKFVTTKQVPGLIDPIKAVVNVDQACNANWNGKFVSLYQEGKIKTKSCANTALIADVIYHEVGHAIDMYTGPMDKDSKGITDNVFSEGIGDIIATYMNDDPEIGHGFYLKDEPMRTALNKKKHPQDLVNEVHQDGQIISAAFWKLHEGYQERYGNKAGARIAAQVFFNHLLTTGAYVDSYDAVNRIDDLTFDDGNATSKSINFCMVNKAFAEHGLADDENCEDKSAIYFDENLKLAVAENDEAGSLTFLAAAKGADKVVLCIGGRDTCRKSKKEDVSFSKLRTAENGIDIFKAAQKVKVEDKLEVTLLSYSGANLKGTSTAVLEKK
ncbi:MAG: hypothetical protein AB7T49_03930 [Oligoflexales bacterium]